MNIQQQLFITEYLRTGDKIQSYKNAYNSESTNYNSLESAANRLMRMPEIVNTIQGIQNSIRAEVEAELKSQLKQELLTIQQKRELLAQIATGQMIAEQHYKGKNCSQCTQYIKPTINQMLKAIDLDNKLAGHYITKENKTPHTFLAQQSRKYSGAGHIDSNAESINLSIGEVNSREPVRSVKHSNLSLPNAFGIGGVSERDGSESIATGNPKNPNTDNITSPWGRQGAANPLRLSGSTVKNINPMKTQQNTTSYLYKTSPPWGRSEVAKK